MYLCMNLSISSVVAQRVGQSQAEPQAAPLESNIHW